MRDQAVCGYTKGKSSWFPFVFLLSCATCWQCHQTEKGQRCIKQKKTRAAPKKKAKGAKRAAHKKNKKTRDAKGVYSLSFTLCSCNSVSIFVRGLTSLVRSSLGPAQHQLWVIIQLCLCWMLVLLLATNWSLPIAPQIFYSDQALCPLAIAPFNLWKVVPLVASHPCELGKNG